MAADADCHSYVAYGGGCMLRTPIGQVPDAWSHVYRISSITNGDILAHHVDSKSLLHQSNENVGGHVDKQWIDFSVANYNGYDPNVVMPETIANAESDTMDVPYNNTATNTPAAYLPQLLAFEIGKVTGLSSQTTYYLAQTFMLVIYSLCMGLCIALLPKYRLLMMLILVEPLMLFRYSFAISADSMTQMMICLFTCLLFHSLWKQPSNLLCGSLAIVSLILAMTKFIYAPCVVLGLLAFLVHGKRMPRAGTAMIVAGNVASFAFLAWWLHVNNWFVTTPSIVSMSEMEARKQSLFTFSGFFAAAKDIITAMVTGQSNLDSRSQTLIILAIYAALLALLVLLVLATVRKTMPTNQLAATWLTYLVPLGIIMLTYLALWLQYTSRDVPGVQGMQWRYLLPFTPMWCLIGLSCLTTLQRKPQHVPQHRA